MDLAANALTTVEAVEQELQIAPGSATQHLTRLINVASEAIESYCGRQFAREAGRVESVIGQGSERIFLAKRPIESIASVVYDGTAIDAADYTIEAKTGALYNPDGWAWTAKTLDLAAPVALPGTEEALYVVTYTGGYKLPKDGAPTGAQVRLPYDLEQAAILTAASMYLGRGRDQRIASEALGDASTSYINRNEAIGTGLGGVIPDAAIAILRRYRVAV